MCHNEDMMPTSVYIQDSHKKHSEKILGYLFPGDSISFTLLIREIDSTIISKRHSSQIDSWLLDDGIYVYLEILY